MHFLRLKHSEVHVLQCISMHAAHISALECMLLLHTCSPLLEMRRFKYKCSCLKCLRSRLFLFFLAVVITVKCKCAVVSSPVSPLLPCARYKFNIHIC